MVMISMSGLKHFSFTSEVFDCVYQIWDCIKLIREAEAVNRLKFVTLEQYTAHVLTTDFSLKLFSYDRTKVREDYATVRLKLGWDWKITIEVTNVSSWYNLCFHLQKFIWKRPIRSDVEGITLSNKYKLETANCDIRKNLLINFLL